MSQNTPRSRRIAADHVFASLVQVVPATSAPAFGIVRNVSATGICIETMQPLTAPGTARMSVSIGEAVYELTMRVVRIVAVRGIHETGLRFARDEPRRDEFLRAFRAAHPDRAG